MTQAEKLAYDFIEEKINEIAEKIKVLSPQLDKLQEEYKIKHYEAHQLHVELNRLASLQREMKKL
jgi:dynactin complex subunit